MSRAEASSFDSKHPSESKLSSIENESNFEYRAERILNTLRQHSQAEGKFPEYQERTGTWSSTGKAGEAIEPVRDIYCYTNNLKIKCSWGDQT